MIQTYTPGDIHKCIVQTHCIQPYVYMFFITVIKQCKCILAQCMSKEPTFATYQAFHWLSTCSLDRQNVHGTRQTHNSIPLLSPQSLPAGQQSNRCSGRCWLVASRHSNLLKPKDPNSGTLLLQKNPRLYFIKNYRRCMSCIYR